MLPKAFVHIESSSPGSPSSPSNPGTLRLAWEEGILVGTRLLVAEMMILASEISAKFAASAKLPYIYRFQNIPIDRKLWDDLPSVTYDRRDAVEMLLKWTRAELSSSPLPHSSLGLSSYARVSSPARRYPDIVNHRQVCVTIGK